MPPHLLGVLERLAATCERPRYSFVMLNLIAQVSARSGTAGPYIEHDDQLLPVRDWLWIALSSVGRREYHRSAKIERA